MVPASPGGDRGHTAGPVQRADQVRYQARRLVPARVPWSPPHSPQRASSPPKVGQRAVDPITEYDPQKRCRPQPKPGTVALAGLLRHRYGPVTIGLSRACRKDRSEHYDGRALDWMVNSRHHRRPAKATTSSSGSPCLAAATSAPWRGGWGSCTSSGVTASGGCTRPTTDGGPTTTASTRKCDRGQGQRLPSQPRAHLFDVGRRPQSRRRGGVADPWPLGARRNYPLPRVEQETDGLFLTCHVRCQTCPAAAAAGHDLDVCLDVVVAAGRHQHTALLPLHLDRAGSVDLGAVLG